MTLASNTPKERNAAFELLRIISMVMVLIVHADYGALGQPTLTDLRDSGVLNITTRVGFEVVAIIAVNLFILISGYFGIRATKEKVFKLLYQCWFVVLGLLLIAWPITPPEHNLAHYLSVTSNNWFVAAYLVLMLFSPLLNAFIKSATPRRLFKYLLLYYCVSYLLGTLIPSNQGFGGYSFLHFITLYMVGALIREKKERLAKIKASRWLAIYIGFTMLLFAIQMIQLWVPVGSSMILVYDSPFVMACSISFFLIFLNIKLHSRFINWVGASVFTVYLFHCHSSLRYLDVLREIYASTSGLLALLCFAATITAYFVGAILFDQLRKISYDKLALPVAKGAYAAVRKSFIKVYTNR